GAAAPLPPGQRPCEAGARLRPLGGVPGTARPQAAAPPPVGERRHGGPALAAGAAPRSTTDWPQHVKKLKATGYDGTITLEVFAPQKEYLLLSRDLLRRWWAEA